MNAIHISSMNKRFHNRSDCFTDATNNFSLTEKHLNESVDCEEESSLHNSLCSYKWTKPDGKGEAVVSNEPTFRPKSLGLYRCTIDCTVKRQPSCSINRMLVYVSTTDNVSTTDSLAQTTTEPSKLFWIYSSDLVEWY